ncbi:hypothetical protein HUJ05_000302 [Dendroctonus ponderosae]|nr:hypothetical protein HUJ05_000302 [Dendroctonus ponderosae]
MANFRYFIGLIMMATAARSINGTMEDFFPDIKQNLTKITWAHAVNNQTYLDATLKNGKFILNNYQIKISQLMRKFTRQDINMIEADIVLGTLINGKTDPIPIMGHPPQNTSDLSLEGFLAQVQSFDSTSNSSKKGIKLDFKTIEVLEASKNIVRSVADKDDDLPIWINADILAGPVNASTKPVNASRFLDVAKSFPKSILSLGWTTAYDSNSNGSYESSQIQEMIDVIRSHNITQEITFPVRAGLAARSLEQLTNLTESIEKSTLTIWSSDGDNVSVEDLRLLISKIGLNRTYIDVPSDLLEQLRLDDLPNSSPSRSVVGAAVWMPVLLVLAGIFQSLSLI